MKFLFVSVLIALASILFGQTTYEEKMHSALDNLENAETSDDFKNAAHAFEEIAKVENDKWQPKYYAILSKTIHAFYLPMPEAMELTKTIEEEYNTLLTLKDNDETKILKGMFLTVKVAKDPMNYGQSLTPIIMNTYHKARKENPKNPRALFEIAEYQISGAAYMGMNPKDFCPLLEESVALFEEEAQLEQQDFEPRWGLDRAQELYTSTCSE